MITHCLMWVIWRVRNTRTFDGNERSIHELKLLFFQTFFDWANATSVFTFISLLDMLNFCTFIVSFFSRCFQNTVCVFFFPSVFSLLFSMKLLLIQKKKKSLTISEKSFTLQIPICY